VLFLSGSLLPGLVDCVIAHQITLETLEARVNEDHFAKENIVSAQIL
jgi:hypothetical protein